MKLYKREAVRKFRRARSRRLFIEKLYVISPLSAQGEALRAVLGDACG